MWEKVPRNINSKNYECFNKYLSIGPLNQDAFGACLCELWCRMPEVLSKLVPSTYLSIMPLWWLMCLTNILALFTTDMCLCFARVVFCTQKSAPRRRKCLDVLSPITLIDMTEDHVYSIYHLYPAMTQIEYSENQKLLGIPNNPTKSCYLTRKGKKWPKFDNRFQLL